MIGLREPSRVSQEIQIFSANYHQRFFRPRESPYLWPGPFFWLDLSGSHHWIFTLGCGEVISGHISLDSAFLRPLQPSKRAKVANFGCFSLFDTRWTIFLTGSKWISPLDIHIRVLGGDIRPYLLGSSLFTASTTLKTGQSGPFWLLWLVWQLVDQFLDWI